MTPVPVLLMARELNLGGTERQLAEIARSLDRTAFEPHVGCFLPEGLRGAELRNAGVPVVRFPVDSFLSPSALGGARMLGAYVRRHGIRVAHAFDVPMNLFGVPAARLYGVPRVVASQRAHRDLTPGLRRHLLRVTDRVADAVVVNCLSVRRELIEEDRVPPSRVHVCYNGVDTGVFRPCPAASDGAELTIGIICALRPEKDLPTLVRAFATVRGEGASARLAIVGDGPVRSELEGLACELGLGGSCAFEPATDRVAERLRGIDIFVLPSRSEALSNSLMEAMACGCAVVASRVGGNSELVTEGETGLLFDAGDVAGLAAALRTLIRRPEVRLRLGAAAAERMRREFSLAASAHRMGEIYTALLGQVC